VWHSLEHEHFHLFQVDPEDGSSDAGHTTSDPLVFFLGHRDACQAVADRVATKDRSERKADDCLNAPLSESRNCMFTARAGTEVFVHHEDIAPLVGLVVEGMAPIKLSAIVLEDMVAETLEGHALEEPCRNDPVGIDVVAREMKSTARDLSDFFQHGV